MSKTARFRVIGKACVYHSKRFYRPGDEFDATFEEIASVGARGHLEHLPKIQAEWPELPEPSPEPVTDTASEPEPVQAAPEPPVSPRKATPRTRKA